MATDSAIRQARRENRRSIIGAVSQPPGTNVKRPANYSLRNRISPFAGERSLDFRHRIRAVFLDVACRRGPRTHVADKLGQAPMHLQLEPRRLDFVEREWNLAVSPEQNHSLSWPISFEQSAVECVQSLVQRFGV